MNAVEIAWVAGIIEGEGTIYVPKIERKRSQYPTLIVAMSDEDIILRLKEITGVGNITTRKRHEHHKQMYTWMVSNRRDVARVLCAVAPLLGQRRSAKVLDAAIALARPPRGPGNKIVPIDNHGTRNGAMRHRRRGETPCNECRLADNEYHRKFRAVRLVT